MNEEKPKNGEDYITSNLKNIVKTCEEGVVELQNAREEYHAAKRKAVKGGLIFAGLWALSAAYLWGNSFQHVPADVARLRNTAAYAQEENASYALDQMASELKDVETEEASQLEKDVSKIREEVKSETAHKYIVRGVAEEAKEVAYKINPLNSMYRLFGNVCALFSFLSLTPMISWYNSKMRKKRIEEKK